jgi:hypothetical protein
MSAMPGPASLENGQVIERVPQGLFDAAEISAPNPVNMSYY